MKQLRFATENPLTTGSATLAVLVLIILIIIIMTYCWSDTQDRMVENITKLISIDTMRKAQSEPTITQAIPNLSISIGDSLKRTKFEDKNHIYPKLDRASNRYLSRAPTPFKAIDSEQFETGTTSSLNEDVRTENSSNSTINQTQNGLRNQMAVSNRRYGQEFLSTNSLLIRYRVRQP